MGWSSASSPALDFRANGSALPMYVLFVVCLALFLVGVWRRLRVPAPSAASTAGNGSGKPGRRLARLLEFAILQRRILRRRSSAWTHLPIFWGFVVLGLGSLTIMVDGYVLRPLGLDLPRGTAYEAFQMTLDLFGLAFVVGIVVAIHRRVWIRPEHKPHDNRALAVLLVLLAIGASGFVLEGLRLRLEDSAEPWAVAGSAVATLIAASRLPSDAGMILYGLLWWTHVVAAFGLLAVAPFLPLRHVLTAPLNIMVAPARPSGALSTPFNLKELMRSGRFDVKTGAASIADFSWRDRLGLLACADSGSCQDVCPAHATGTALSPMRLVAVLRDEVDSAEPLDRALLEDAIWSCTLCGACSAACPTLVDPTRYVVELRRDSVAANRLGQQRTGVLANLTLARNPYGSNGAVRRDLAAQLGLPTPGERRDVDMLYWIGCAATFDSRVRAVAEATVKILDRAGIRPGVLGPAELCCGDPARRIGEEGLFQDLAFRNIETFERHGVKTILTHCAHCFNTLHNEYRELGARVEVVHHATLFRNLLDKGAIEPRRPVPERATLHDSCYAGRLNGAVEPPRAVLRSIAGTELTEMGRSGERAMCCGAGGANYWYDVPRVERIGSVRMREAQATRASLLVTECPFCLKMLEDARNSTGDGVPMKVRDIAEVLADALGEGSAT